MGGGYSHWHDLIYLPSTAVHVANPWSPPQKSKGEVSAERGTDNQKKDKSGQPGHAGMSQGNHRLRAIGDMDAVVGRGAGLFIDAAICSWKLVQVMVRPAEGSSRSVL